MASQPTPTPDDKSATDLIVLTADIVAAHVSSNGVTPEQIPALIRNVHQALAGLGSDRQQDEARPNPAVSIRSSVKADHIVCLEDGKKMKMLKRHLMTDHGMTPTEYRERWGLPATYPMVAPDYAEKRRDLAKQIGLGRRPRAKAASKAVPKARARNGSLTRKPPKNGNAPK